jgi:hypothetical protein
MSDDSRKMYTVRLPERIASQLEARAAQTGTTPTTLIRSLIVHSFESNGPSDIDRPPPKATEYQSQASNRPVSESESRQEQHHRQLLYEIGKMRSVLLHSLDHTLSADTVDDIIEASERTASDYVTELLRSKGGQQ